MSDSSAAGKTAGKVRGRPFKPGDRANPSGRPKGALQASTKLRRLLDIEDAELAAATLRAAVRSGDLNVAKFVVERFMPTAKTAPISIQLPDISTPAGLVAAQSALVQAVAEGRILPDVGELLSTMLDNHRQATHMVELADRALQLLENQQRLLTSDGVISREYVPPF